MARKNDRMFGPPGVPPGPPVGPGGAAADDAPAGHAPEGPGESIDSIMETGRELQKRLRPLTFHKIHVEPVNHIEI